VACALLIDRLLCSPVPAAAAYVCSARLGVGEGYVVAQPFSGHTLRVGNQSLGNVFLSECPGHEVRRSEEQSNRSARVGLGACTILLLKAPKLYRYGLGRDNVV
jgi:hypothetical protein